MSADHIYPRSVEPRSGKALADTPVVLIHGPRQFGKTTLARMAGQKRDYAYFSFDDELTLAAAMADPVGFIADLPERVICGRPHEPEIRLTEACRAAHKWHRPSMSPGASRHLD